MTLIALHYNASYAANVAWKQAKSFCLSDDILNCVPCEALSQAQKALLELCIQNLPCVDGDKWTNMRIHLRHDESIDVEKLS